MQPEELMNSVMSKVRDLIKLEGIDHKLMVLTMTRMLKSCVPIG